MIRMVREGSMDSRNAGSNTDGAAQVAVACSTEDVDCPRCGAEMVRRTARRGPHTGQPFLGCVRFPDCRGTRQPRAEC
jgi:ssDNA-binding Zn-finger/Zn-ribbon topoisomerase 1